MSQFVFVRKVVTNLSLKGFVKRVTKPLRQMFGCRGKHQPSLFILIPFHNASQRIVFGRTLSLVAQQTFDLFPMLSRKCASEMEEAARHTLPLSLTGRTNYYFW